MGGRLVNLMTTPDEATFAARFEPHRRELHLHCYRMLGSFTDAEDLVQETFLRAWNRRGTFEDRAEGGTSSLRAWLYRIATNASIDAIRTRRRQTTAVDSFVEVPWLQPYPDRLLDEVASADDDPEAVAVARETIELAFLAAIQLLPARQRAVLITRDVLGWSAAETASLLEISVAAANSALQRARATLHRQGPEPHASRAGLTDEEEALLAGFIDAHQRGDAELALSLARHDIRVTMPPNPMRFDGRDALASLLARAFGPDAEGEWRLLPTRANRMPAAASYLREHGGTGFRAFKLDVLRVEDGSIAEITTFGWSLFPHFGLPSTV
jgi:RNA polymerase sigma-70 factor (TIGR02960 family)